MQRDFNNLDLDDELDSKVRSVITECSRLGVEMLFYSGYRSPTAQARLYRQSRTLTQIFKKSRSLANKGFHHLGGVLIAVGPQMGELGKHITMAGPGESWHNFRLAVDGVPMVNGKPAWDADKYPKEWAVYGKAVVICGLQWAGDWTKFKELPHAQMREGSNPLKVLTPEEVLTMGSIPLIA